MTQELVLESIMLVAKKRGFTGQRALQKLDITKGDLIAYKSGQKALHFDTFFAWCVALKVSAHNILARATIMYEDRASAFIGGGEIEKSSRKNV